MTIAAGAPPLSDNVEATLDRIFEGKEESIEDLQLSLSSHPAYSASGKHKQITSSNDCPVKCCLDFGTISNSSLHTEALSEAVENLLSVNLDESNGIRSVLGERMCGSRNIQVDSFLNSYDSGETGDRSKSSANEPGAAKSSQNLCSVKGDCVVEVFPTSQQSYELLPGQAEMAAGECTPKEVCYRQIPYVSSYITNAGTDAAANLCAEDSTSALEDFDLDESFDYDNMRLTRKF